jgi:Kef-type K+ transport system membrane component KefB
MSIDFRTLADNAGTLAIAVVGIVTVRAVILAGLGFVLFGSAFSAELIGHRGLALGYLTVSVSMVFTPSLMRLGDRIAGRLRGELATA